MKLFRCKPSRFSHKYRGEICLNCNHPLDISDKFCPSCGQQNSTKKISFWDLVQEIFSSFLSYDSKLWRTLKLMFLKPGQLSLYYINGMRNTYTNPFRFFLSVSVVFFLILSQLIDDENYNDFSFFGQEDEIEEIEDYKELSESSNFIKGIKVGMEEPKKVAEDAKMNEHSNEVLTDSTLTKNDAFLNKEDKLRDAFKENKYLKYEEAIEKSLITDSFFDWVRYRFVRGLAKTDKNIAGFLRYLIPKIPFFIFIFIPLFTLTYFLLFFGSGKTYVDHLVFNFNLSSFVLIVYALGSLFDEVIKLSLISGVSTVLINLGIFFYTYKSIRKFYGHGRWLSGFKTLVISFFYPTILIIFLVFLVALSFIFF